MTTARWATDRGTPGWAQDGQQDGRAAWRCFPLRWPDVRRFAAAWLLLTVAFLGLGALLVHGLADGVIGDVDLDVARWFADQRTPTVEGLAQVGAGLADSFVIVPLVLVTSVVFVVVWKRWNETILVLTSILFEKAVFVTVTYVIGRDRPPVGQLDGAPPTSSFPSGHVAASVAFYGALALVVWAHTRRAWLRTSVGVLVVVVVVAVALSRMLLGMHYLTDTIAGALLGAVGLAVAVRLTRRTVEDLDARRHLDGRAEAQEPTAERHRADRAPRRAEGQAGDHIAQPVHAEQHP